MTVIATIRPNQTTEVRAEGKDYDEAKAVAGLLQLTNKSATEFNLTSITPQLREGTLETA